VKEIYYLCTTKLNEVLTINYKFMPNYVIHKVKISGSVETISKVKKQIINTKDENGNVFPFSFQSIIPRPVSLNIPASSGVLDGIDYIKGNISEKKKIEARYATYTDGKNHLKEHIRLAEIALDNIKKYGYKDWSDWNIDNWGTKWDAHDPYVETTDDEIMLEFTTAWSTPEPVFLKLAEQYPDLMINIDYADEDMGFNCGTYSYADGNWEYQIGDLEFACLMWGENPEEYCEEKED
jgi:hypothetical protein